ncbi:multidrug resistance-related protein [Pseudomassariella vexata]|uniref:Multidrug resistance-related protein n=1 Tax=Pseudomassariella vexata TaxID=1141098 RepID=A0A1Y2EJA8_9PEZI|nr:multidrug resistance-related protein [Pseudomassariella vexata]ORY71658.1 multidrug resistance-related protein [Pseudomassariella vexata]
MDSAKPLVCDDNSFGPGVKSPDCRGSFDFTILFEESIFTILPATLFILLAPFRALRLLRRRIRVKRTALYAGKVVAIGAYIGLQLAVLVLTAHSAVQTQVSIASATLSLASGLSLAVLSHLEHAKSIRPSFLINIYLIATVLLDIARVRTQWLLGEDGVVAGVLTASVAVKVGMLLLEAAEKRSLLLGLDRNFSIESTSGVFSRSSFWWLNSLLVSGFKKVLTMDDLPAIHEKLDSDRLAVQLQLAWGKCNQKRKHSLAYACLWSLRWEVLVIAVPKFCYVGLSLTQPYLIQDVIAFVQTAETESENTGYGLIGAFGFVYLGLAIMTGWFSHLSFRMMTMIRGELITAIYAKMMTLQINNLNESAAMTLMGADVQRIAETFYFLVIDVIPSVVQLGIAMYLLYVQLGAVCVAPIIIATISTALSTLLAGHVTVRQKAWFEVIQRRINYTSEILGSMRNVKMLGLTETMSANIQQMREVEMDSSRRSRKVQSLNVSLVNLPEVFNRFLIFAACAIAAKIQGTDGVSVSQAITALAALNLLTSPLADILSAIPTGWAALGCFERIREFLLEPSRVEQRLLQMPSRDNTRRSTQSQAGIELQSMESPMQNAIRLDHGSFGWSESSCNIVQEVSTTVQADSHLTILVGPVGCGKSTFLKALLGETPQLRGQLSVSESQIAYCDQTPWIINGSIRDNVVAGSDFDEAWYSTTVHVSALDTDLRQMPEGDSTVVGSKGVKLSGGQKQRLSIARAVYSRKKLAILDDVLSGLDSATEEIVFKRVFSREGIFRMTGTTVIMATHSVKRLPQADLILVLDQTGTLIEQGTFSELNVPGNYIHRLQVKLEEENRHEETDGTTAQPYARPKNVRSETSVADESRKTGDWTTYKYYIRSLGPWYMATFVALVAANDVCSGMINVWINWWASSNESGGDSRLGYWLGIYGFLGVMEGVFLVGAVAFLWIVIIPKSGSNLHRSILDAAMRAPLSFFAETETGVLVNRFSQDLRLADMTLPGSIINCAFQLGTCAVVTALSVTAVGYFAAVLPAVLGALYFIQRFYLRTSRQLRLLELEANAPLYSHFIESLNGLVTIRSFGWTGYYTARNVQFLNTSQKPFYLLLCIQRWLVLVLDLVVAGLAVLLVGMAVALRSQLVAGFLGLALVNMMNLSHSLTYLVQHWTNLETSLGAIARIKDFSDKTPAEESLEDSEDPGANWPTRGALRFEGVSASYSDPSSPALKNLSFSIEGGQKIGLVGRTGSGKSSSTLAVMRLINVVSGRIILDDVDLSTIPGSIIRERVICLTQDPFLFPASIRSNVDPRRNASDAAIVAALEKVGLWTVLRDRAADKNNPTASTILNNLMDTEFLSHGQRQLFCLARAMLKKGKVLILDEPTSSVDTQTDAKMQEIIRSEFRDHTILMIAHRLSSLLDFDRVAVLDGGRLVEFGRPAELLRDSESSFAKLYQASSGRSHVLV